MFWLQAKQPSLALPPLGEWSLQSESLLNEASAGGERVNWVFYPLFLVVQLAFLYAGLTYFAAMWKGAQDQGKHGWVVSLLFAFGLLVILNCLHYAHDIAGSHLAPWSIHGSSH